MVSIVPKECPECKSSNVKWNHEEVVCGDCGLILSDVFYSGKRMMI